MRASSRRLPASLPWPRRWSRRARAGLTQVQLLSLLGAERIGITLSEEFQLHPEQSTSAIVVHHPQATYFSV